MTDYSVLLPCVPRRLEQALPFAGLVRWTGASRLWQGQAMVMEPHQTFTGLAGAGFRVPTGFGVTLMPLRHPYEAALQARSVALATGEPVIAGFGPGSTAFQENILGAPYEKPLQVARQYVTAVRRLLDGETVDHEGPHVTLRQATVGVAAAQLRIPLLVGGNGDAVLATAAVHADTVGLVGFTSGTGRRHTNLSHFTWAGLEERIAHVRRAAGSRADTLELNVLVQMVRGGDRAASADEVGAAFHQPAELVLDSPFVMLGDTGAMVDHVQRLRAAGVSYVVAFAERGAADLAPVIGRVR